MIPLTQDELEDKLKLSWNDNNRVKVGVTDRRPFVVSGKVVAKNLFIYFFRSGGGGEGGGL